MDDKPQAPESPDENPSSVAVAKSLPMNSLPNKNIRNRMARDARMQQVWWLALHWLACMLVLMICDKLKMFMNPLMGKLEEAIANNMKTLNEMEE